MTCPQPQRNVIKSLHFHFLFTRSCSQVYIAPRRFSYTSKPEWYYSKTKALSMVARIHDLSPILAFPSSAPTHFPLFWLYLASCFCAEPGQCPEGMFPPFPVGSPYLYTKGQLLFLFVCLFDLACLLQNTVSDLQLPPFTFRLDRAWFKSFSSNVNWTC